MQEVDGSFVRENIHLHMKSGQQQRLFNEKNMYTHIHIMEKGFEIIKKFKLNSSKKKKLIGASRT